MEILKFLRDSAADYPCPSCRASLAGCAVDLLRTEGNLYTVEVTCSHCDVVFVVVLRLEMEDETTVVSSAPAITPDEVLDVHEALAKLTGPITELFSERSGR